MSIPFKVTASSLLFKIAWVMSLSAVVGRLLRLSDTAVGSGSLVSPQVPPWEALCNNIWWLDFYNSGRFNSDLDVSSYVMGIIVANGKRACLISRNGDWFRLKSVWSMTWPPTLFRTQVISGLHLLALMNRSCLVRIWTHFWYCKEKAPKNFKVKI
jgi:hypothetical protein